MAKPTLAEVRSLAAEIRASQPDIGNKKLAAEIKLAQPQWKLGNKELRNALRPPTIKQLAVDAVGPGAGEDAQCKKRASSTGSAAPAPAQKKRKQAQLQVPEKIGGLGSLPGSFPYEIDQADHAETPLVAYEDVAPVLRGLARHLSKQPADLKIWDPFYCTGAAAKRLASVGFPSVHHRCEDFHSIIAAGGDALPEHDVLLTNPPYSADHLQKLFQHCVGSGKAWALLLPWFVVRKPWFRAYAAGSEDRVAFLCPQKRYFFQPPKAMVEDGRDRVTAPFDTFWYLHMGSPAAQREILAGWRVERAHRRLSCEAGVLERAFLEHGAEHDADGHNRGSSTAGEIPAVAAALLKKSAEDAEAATNAGLEGQGTRCRLGVGFKKRRGTPGYHTLLDAKGLLIGRPVPENWSAKDSATH